MAALDTNPKKAGPASARKESPVHLVLRILAMLVGLTLSVLAVAAGIGMLIDNVWICLVLAGALVITPALYLADRLLPENDVERARGIPTDVLSLLWLGGATLAFGPLGGRLHEPLHAFLERLAGRGMIATAADFATGHPAPPMRGTDAGVDAGTTHAAAQVPDAGRPDAAQAAPAVVPPATEADASVAPRPVPPPADALSPSAIFREFAGSVVTLEVANEHGLRGSGTGFFLDGNGLLATNEHVIHGASAVRVKLFDGAYARSVKLLVADEENDLALLEVRGPTPPTPVRLGDSEQIVVGERVVVIGNPLGLDHTLSDGIVSARRRVRTQNMVQITAPLSPGNSGGPVFDARGNVIGISTAVIGLGIGQNLNLAVPVNQLRSMLRPTYPNPRDLGGSEGLNGGHW